MAFFFYVGLYQGSALSSFLFTSIIDGLIRDIQDEVPGCKLFADDVVLINDTMHNNKLKRLRHTLESRCFKLSI